MRQTLGRVGGELGQLVVGAAIGAAGLVLLSLVLLSLPASLAGGLGILLVVGVVWVTRRLADLQRRRAAAVLGKPVASPYAPLPRGCWRGPARWSARRPPGVTWPGCRTSSWRGWAV